MAQPGVLRAVSALYGAAAPCANGVIACAARLSALVGGQQAAWVSDSSSRRCASSSTTPPADGDRDKAESQAGPSTSGGGAGGAPPLRPAPKSLFEALQAATAPIVKGDLTGLPWEGAAGAPTQSAGSPETDDLSASASHGVTLPELSSSTGDGGAFGAAGSPGVGPGSTSTSAPGGGPSSLWHPRYGYAALGGVDPEASRKAAARSKPEPGSRIRDMLAGLSAPQPRIHPRRKFLPGQVYEPQDLNPFAAPSSRRARKAEAPQRLRPRDVEELADYKNVLFLSKLLSPAGRLLPRKQTKLPIPLHRMACRQVKLARSMGLMAGEARLDKLHLARERERELRELQESRYGAIGGVPPLQQQQQFL